MDRSLIFNTNNIMQTNTQGEGASGARPLSNVASTGGPAGKPVDPVGAKGGEGVARRPTAPAPADTAGPSAAPRSAQPDIDSIDLGWTLVERGRKPPRESANPAPKGTVVTSNDAQPRSKPKKKTRRKKRPGKDVSSSSQTPQAVYVQTTTASSTPEPTNAPGPSQGKGINPQPNAVPPLGGPRQNAAARRAEKRERERAAAKRERPEETLPPADDRKKQRLGSVTQPGVTYADTARKTEQFGVAVTAVAPATLDKAEASLVSRALQLQIIHEATTADLEVSGPEFEGRPVFAGGFLRLWCRTQQTMEWLKNTVAGIEVPSGTKLKVILQTEIPRRVRCGLVIPDLDKVWGETKDIGRALCFQNRWAGVNRWLIHDRQEQEGEWFLLLSPYRFHHTGKPRGGHDAA